MDLLILVPKVTNRINYIFELIFGNLLGLDFKITSNKDSFDSFDGAKLHYGDKPFGDELFQKSTSILFEHFVIFQKLVVVDYNDIKTIFPVHHKNSIFPFDLFAASFYFVTRYEEYMPYVPDKYNRFQAKDSILYKTGLLKKPIVNIWAMELGEILQSRYPNLRFKKRSFSFVPTYDVDAAWAYRNKGFVRITSAFIRDLLRLDFAEMGLRFKVLSGKKMDPFDTFDYQIELQKELNLHPLYFILCGNYDVNDKNISIKNSEFQDLIKRLGDYANIGIHPSFSSYLDNKRLREEIRRLSNILNREITMSRQHFLRLNMPVSYQKLIELDITDDYTMGYASLPGFRAGICDTFRFYDLEHDVPTSLNIHPFALMDGTMRDYLDLSTTESYALAVELLQAVKDVNGTFILLWHNETLSDEKRWKGWITLYRKILDYALN